MTTILAVAAIFLLASFVQGVSGFGSALVALPLLVYCIDIKEAIPLCLLNSLIITTYLVILLRKNMQRRFILPLCLGSIPGILIGTTVLIMVPGEVIRRIIGVLLVLYSIHYLMGKVQPRPLHIIWGYIAGFFTGAIGSAFSAGGPPAIIYTTMNDWDKDTIKATLTAFFFFNSLVIVVAHAMTGLTTPAVVHYFIYSIPSVLAGTALGSFCYRFFKKEVYLRIIFVFLLVMGVAMVI